MTPPTHIAHKTLYLSDGNLLLLPTRTKSASGRPHAYRVNRGVVDLHSRFIASKLARESNTVGDAPQEIVLEDVLDEEVEAFLQHVYSDYRISPTTPFPRLASVLRASAPTKLDSPVIYSEALHHIRALFPDEPIADFEHPHLEDAALLLREFPDDLKPIRRIVYYALIRTSPSSETLPPPLPHILNSLMTLIIETYSPTLYEPGRSSFHMACSDVLGSKWGEFVGHPGMEAGEVYQPLESLERIGGMPWGEAGVCDQCVRDLRGKWGEEKGEIWGRMEGWIQGIERGLV